jgi:hypothetical protein
VLVHPFAQVEKVLQVASNPKNKGMLDDPAKRPAILPRKPVSGDADAKPPPPKKDDKTAKKGKGGKKGAKAKPPPPAKAKPWVLPADGLLKNIRDLVVSRVKAVEASRPDYKHTSFALG